MITVAIVGGDGAGKTTIAKKLEQSFPFPVKYLYMGISTRSSNHALLTSRLVLLLKQRSYKIRVRKSGIVPTEYIPAHDLEYGQKERGSVWTAARFLNRFLEAWYRQLISLYYQARGYLVVYDRHPLFDMAPLPADEATQRKQKLDAFCHWIIRHAFPKPHMAILLDAPAKVIYERKGEATVKYLNRQRRVFLEQGKWVETFVQIDATQTLDKVLEDVMQHIMEFQASKRNQKLEGDH